MNQVAELSYDSFMMRMRTRTERYRQNDKSSGEILRAFYDRFDRFIAGRRQRIRKLVVYLPTRSILPCSRPPAAAISARR